MVDSNKPDDSISRRKLLASLGVAGAGVVLYSTEGAIRIQRLSRFPTHSDSNCATSTDRSEHRI